jgi:hypothetical protein
LNGWLKNYKNTLIFSPSITFDKTWTAIEDERNVLVSEECNDAILEDVLKKQKALYRKSKKNDLLIILDDFSSILRSKGGGFSKTLDKLFSTCRHFATSIVVTAQYFSHISPTCRLNSTNLVVFRLNDKEYRKMAEEYRIFLTDKEFIDMAIDSTQEKYHFFYINLQTEDETKVFSEGFQE